MNKVYVVAVTYTGECCASAHVQVLRFLCKDEATACKRAEKWCTRRQFEPGDLVALTNAELNKLKLR